MVDEPVAGESRHRCQGAVLLEEMGRARDELEAVFTAEELAGFLVQLEHDLVQCTDDQERRRLDGRKPWSGQVRPATTGDDRPYAWVAGGRPERRRRAGARPEVPEP